MERRPRFDLVKRASLARGPCVAVVQDAGSWGLACVPLDLDGLDAWLERLGHVLVDDWRAVQVGLAFPGDRDRRVDDHSDLSFVLR